MKLIEIENSSLTPNEMPRPFVFSNYPEKANYPECQAQMIAVFYISLDRLQDNIEHV